MAVKKQLLFVDTNIWLDFYRSRPSDVAIELLASLEGIKDKIIVTHILEMEYKSNRQSAILEGLKLLQSPPKPPTLGILSDAQASKSIAKHSKEIEKRIKRLQDRLKRALRNPQVHDRVYQTCQRIFHRADRNLIFSIDTDRRLKRVIRERAMRRFVLGCPPRKADDTSIGDAINWEWMVRCAQEEQAELVILTRDSDYGAPFGDDVLLDEHLKQEFKERVSLKRDVRVYKLASHALKHFHVSVTKKVADAERKFISTSAPSVTQATNERARYDQIQEWIRQLTAKLTVSPTGGDTAQDWLDDDEPTGVASADEFEDLTFPPPDDFELPDPPYEPEPPFVAEPPFEPEPPEEHAPPFEPDDSDDRR